MVGVKERKTLIFGENRGSWGGDDGGFSFGNLVLGRYSGRMQSKATTVAAYLESLPPDRREALEKVRRVFLENLDPQYEEGMGYGMMGYHVPHSVWPHGYHCDPKLPLPFAGMASQKGHMSVYMMCLYGETPHAEWFKKAWAKTGKKLDMGKACIRFKRVEDLALDVIAETLRRVPVAEYLRIYQKSLAQMGKGVDGKPLKKARGAKAGGRKKGAGKTSGKKAASKKTARR